MSAIDRATRRDLRRAVGEQVCELVEKMHVQIAKNVAAVNALNVNQKALTADIVALRERNVALQARVLVEKMHVQIAENVAAVNALNVNQKALTADIVALRERNVALQARVEELERFQRLPVWKRIVAHFPEVQQ